jgi:prevent-host-death family protein
MAWQLQEAKQRFSEVVRRAEEEGPQVVTRHGEEIAVVVSMQEWRAATGATPSLRDFLLADSPPYWDEVELPAREIDTSRDVDFSE